MASYIAIFLSLLCLVFLFVFLFRLKKYFSAESIVEKSREYMNKMVKDLNNNAKTDMELMNETSLRLHALLNEADKKMKTYEEATERLRNMIAEVERLSNSSIQPNSVSEKLIISKVTSGYEENKNVANLKTISQRNKENIANKYLSNQNQRFSPDDSFVVTKEDQPSLFSSEENNSIFRDETNITAEGAAYKEVPLIITNVYEDKPVVHNDKGVAKLKVNEKQSLSKKVFELFNQGMSVEQIATELSCSVTEVQLIIDIN